MHAVCCQGCRAAAEWIGELGLADYYRLRTAPAVRAPSSGESARDAAAFTRPQLARHFVREAGDGASEVLLLVEGIRCSACCWLIERALAALPGIREAGVNAAGQRARIVFDAGKVSLAQVLEALARVGYRAVPLDRAAQDESRRREVRDAQKRLAVAGFGAMQAMMYASALWFGAFDAADTATRDFFRWLTLGVATPVVLYSAAPFFAGALALLRARRLGMDIAVSLAVTLAYAGSVYEVVTGGPDIWFESVGMFVFFLGLGRYLEMRARHRAADLSQALAGLAPAFAERLEPDGSLCRIGANELAPGDRVVVADGARVPADGELEDIACRVDEALLTGESAAVAKRRGEALCAGSVVIGSPATLRITRVGADTVAAGLVALAARAASQRPAVAREGERAAGAFVARILLLAAATALGWSWVDASQAFSATVAVLVVGCPCAFALAAPAAATRALSVLTGRGVLVVKADALEGLAGVTTVLFDKTGTLTEPCIAPNGTATRAGIDPADAIAIAAALSQGSPHAISRAFVALAPAGVHAVSQRESFAGRGIGGVIAGRRYRLGRADFALATAASHELEDAIVLADSEGLMAAFRIDERLRPGALAAVEALARAGVGLAIASGDASARVASVAAQLGITEWKARLSPEGKLALLAAIRARGERVAVVGDGINDAPMLAGADVGIAMATAADATHAASDVVLTGRLDALAGARTLAREMLSVLRQNRRWAVAYNFAAVPLAAIGLVPPWLAAIGMSASSLAVVLNALRIGRKVPAPASQGVAPPDPAPVHAGAAA